MILNVWESIGNFFKKLYRKFIVAWKQVKLEKAQKKGRRKRRKKQQQQQQIIQNDNFQQEKYTIAKFKNDLMLELVKYLTEKSLIAVNSKNILLLCKEDYGLNANLYFVFKSNNYYKLFDTNTFKFTLIDFKDRFVNIKEKNIQTNNNFTNMIRIFNGLFANIMGYPLNQILIESVLYNCPNDLYNETDCFEMFIKIKEDTFGRCPQ